MAIEAMNGDNAYKPVQQVQQVQPVKQVQPVTTTGKVVQETEVSVPEMNNLEKMEEEFSQTRQGEVTDKKDSPEKMHKALDDINKQLLNTSCQYGFDDVTNRVTIKIIDKDTDKVIRELPPEKTLEMIAKAWELAGLLVDKKL